MGSKAILFDLDGTLVDSSETLSSFVGYLCEKYAKQNVVRINGKNYDLAKPKDLKAIFPEPYYQFYELIGFNWVRDKLLIKWEFNKFLMGNIAPLILGMDGIVEKLFLAGYKLGVVTSSTQPVTFATLVQHGLKNRFGSIICEEDVENPKPHPEPIIKCLAELEADKEGSIYWGDLPGDIECAKAAGVRSIAVTWGFGTRQRLATAEPHELATDIESLERILGL